MATNKNRIQGYISDTAYQYLEKFKGDNELSSTSQALEKILEGLAGESEEILQPATSKFKSELFEEVYDRVTSETEMFIDRKTNRLEKEIEQLEKKLSELQSSLNSKLDSIHSSDLLSKLNNSESDLPSKLNESKSELLNNELLSKLPSGSSIEKSEGRIKITLVDGRELINEPSDKVSTKLLEKNLDSLTGKKPRWRVGSWCRAYDYSGEIVNDLKIVEISPDRKSCTVVQKGTGLEVEFNLDRLRKP